VRIHYSITFHTCDVSHHHHRAVPAYLYACLLCPSMAAWAHLFTYLPYLSPAVRWPDRHICTLVLSNLHNMATYSHLLLFLCACCFLVLAHSSEGMPIHTPATSQCHHMATPIWPHKHSCLCACHFPALPHGRISHLFMHPLCLRTAKWWCRNACMSHVAPGIIHTCSRTCCVPVVNQVLHTHTPVHIPAMSQSQHALAWAGLFTCLLNPSIAVWQCVPTPVLTHAV